MRKNRSTVKSNSPAPSSNSAVIYTRVSSKEQQQEGFSLDAQLKQLMDYSRSKGFEIIGTYLDVESAKSEGRTEFNNLVEFIRTQKMLPTGGCHTVLVEKTDRFYRNVNDLFTIKNLGVSVHLVKEGVIMTPNSNCNDKFVHGMNVLLAERMVNNLSEETQKGMLEKAQQGIWPSQAPIGYMNTEGANGKRVIEQDDVRAPLVMQLFEFYATGIYSLQDAAKESCRLGLTHRKSGNKLNKSAIFDLLNNPIYYGDFYWKGVLYSGTHTPIITKELFNKVQHAMDKGRPGKIVSCTT